MLILREVSSYRHVAFTGPQLDKGRVGLAGAEDYEDWMSFKKVLIHIFAKFRKNGGHSPSM